MSKAPSYISIADLNAISPGEAIVKAKEDTKKLASKNHIPDQDLLANHDMARGVELEANELIRRLQLLDPKILVQKGGIEGAVAVRYPLKDEETGEIKPQYVTGFYLQKLPEYSSVTLDNMGVAHREIRGWRSVLMALIQRGILDPKKVELLFGPALGQRTGLWYRGLQGQGKN